jgi:hypothetical protein
LTKGFARGIPDFDDMITMMAEAVVRDDKISEKLRGINQIYKYLSKDFIYFSTDALPDTLPQPFNSVSGMATLWGFQGIIFFINIIEPVMNYYFKELMKHDKLT